MNFSGKRALSKRIQVFTIIFNLLKLNWQSTLKGHLKLSMSTSLFKEMDRNTRNTNSYCPNPNAMANYPVLASTLNLPAPKPQLDRTGG